MSWLAHFCDGSVGQRTRFWGERFGVAGVWRRGCLFLQAAPELGDVAALSAALTRKREHGAAVRVGLLGEVAGLLEPEFARLPEGNHELLEQHVAEHIGHGVALAQLVPELFRKLLGSTSSEGAVEGRVESHPVLSMSGTVRLGVADAG